MHRACNTHGKGEIHTTFYYVLEDINKINVKGIDYDTVECLELNQDGIETLQICVISLQTEHKLLKAAVLYGVIPDG